MPSGRGASGAEVHIRPRRTSREPVGTGRKSRAVRPRWTSLGLAGWTRCPAAAAQPGDVFCRNHREAACGIVLGLLNDQKLADDATASREMARMAGSYFASQYWSRLCGKKTPAAAGPNSGVRSPVDSTGVRTPDVEPQP